MYSVLEVFLLNDTLIILIIITVQQWFTAVWWWWWWCASVIVITADVQRVFRQRTVAETITSTRMSLSRAHTSVNAVDPPRRLTYVVQWRRSQVKSGGINIEKIEGVGSVEGLCPPQLGVWGLAPRKENNFALKLCNSEQVLVLLSYITAESGGLSPSPESGGTYPSAPPPLLRRLWRSVVHYRAWCGLHPGFQDYDWRSHYSTAQCRPLCLSPVTLYAGYIIPSVT